MTYAIFDTGNLVASFDEEDAAPEALDRIAREDEGAEARIVLVAFDDSGRAVDDCVPGERIAHRV
jgi:hypothetical protein